MPVHFAPVTGIFRVYPPGCSFENRDRYIAAVSAVLLGDGRAYLFGATSDRIFTREVYREIGRQLRAMGVTHAEYERRGVKKVRTAAQVGIADTSAG